MIRKTGQIGLAVVLSLAGSVGSARAEESGAVMADRTPLTFRDSGVYCNYGFVHGPSPESDGVKNLLPAGRAASDQSPWSFYIMQYSERNKSTLDQSLIRDMAANGKKVILRVKLPGKHHGPRDVAASQETIRKILTEQVDPRWLYAITLDEENVYWDGNSETLSALYHWCKQQWPDLPVYQWWTPMEVPNARAEKGWVALPADGWVIDLYLMEREKFEKSVLKTLETGKPMVHIVWSSPTWPLSRKGEHDEATWWEAVGRPSFEEQMEVCRAYNIPVAHFVTQPGRRVDGKKVESIRWGWQAVDPRVWAHYNWTEVYARNLRHLPDAAVGYRTGTPALYDWAHLSGGSESVRFDVDDAGRQTVTVTVAGEELASRPGTQRVPVAVEGVGITCHLSPAAEQLVEPLALTGREGKTVRVPIEFRIEHSGPWGGDVTLEADVFTRPELGGSAKLRYSTDGRTWSEPVVSTEKDKGQTIRAAVPAGELRDNTTLRIEVELIASAGVQTKVATRLNRFRFTRVDRDILAAVVE